METVVGFEPTSLRAGRMLYLSDTIMFIGSGGKIRTYDFKVMSLDC